jgi:hypothetical protein
MSRDGDAARLHRVLELPMAAPCAVQCPAVLFDVLDESRIFTPYKTSVYVELSDAAMVLRQPILAPRDSAAMAAFVRTAILPQAQPRLPPTPGAV